MQGTRRKVTHISGWAAQARREHATALTLISSEIASCNSRSASRRTEQASGLCSPEIDLIEPIHRFEQLAEFSRFD
jgi:hypothetical protein